MAPDDHVILKDHHAERSFQGLMGGLDQLNDLSIRGDRGPSGTRGYSGPSITTTNAPISNFYTATGTSLNN